MAENRLRAKHPKLSRLGLGTAQFGMAYGYTAKLTQGQADRILEACKAAGINLLDTAPAYGDSEEMIGRHTGSATDFLTATKLQTIDEAAARDRGRMTALIAGSIEASLKALGVDRVPMLMLHQTDAFVAENDDFWNAVSGFKNKYGSFGISVYDLEPARELIRRRANSIDFIQAPYNALDRRFEALVPDLRKTGIAFVARSVFLKGVIPAAEEKIPSELDGALDAKRKLASLAASAGLSVPEAALLFVAARNWVDHIVFGAVTAEEVRMNVEAMDRLERFKAIDREVSELGTASDPGLTDPRRWKSL